MAPAKALILAAGALALAACQDGYEDEFKETNPVAKDSDVVDRGIAPLNAAQIRAYLSNSTLSHQGEKRIWHIYLDPDGRLWGLSETEDGGKERARGSWEVKPSGLICRQWDSDWGGGKSGCAEVYQYGNEYVFAAAGSADGGQKEFRRTREPGDPYKIR